MVISIKLIDNPNQFGGIGVANGDHPTKKSRHKKSIGGTDNSVSNGVKYVLSKAYLVKFAAQYTTCLLVNRYMAA